MIGWANARFALPALFVLAFAEGNYFPIPPDVLLIAMCIGSVQQSYRYAWWCAAGSVIGAPLDAIGFFLWDLDGVRDFFFDYVPGVTPESVAQVSALYDDWSFWIVFAAAFTLFPTRSSRSSPASAASASRCFWWAPPSAAPRASSSSRGCSRVRPGIKDFIERRFALVTCAGAVVFVGGFAAVKLLLHDDA